jgi:hypothetical protein
VAPFILLAEGASSSSSKVAMKGLWTGEPTNTKKNNPGTPNAQQRGTIDTKSPDEICRPDFLNIFLGKRSSGRVVCGQRAENEGENVQFSWRGKFFYK